MPRSYAQKEVIGSSYIYSTTIPKLNENLLSYKAKNPEFQDAISSSREINYWYFSLT